MSLIVVPSISFFSLKRLFTFLTSFQIMLPSIFLSFLCLNQVIIIPYEKNYFKNFKRRKPMAIQETLSNT